MTPIDIAVRRELFVDDHLIDRLDGAALKLAAPERKDVSFVGDAAWEDFTCGALSIVNADGKHRLYYRASIPDLKNEDDVIIAMAESSDGGRSFHRPELGLIEFNGSKANNIVWRGGQPSVPPAFLDANPAAAPAARFKGIASSWGKAYAMGSPDGLRWSPIQPGPLVMDGSFDTINTAFWDKLAGCYRSYTRSFTDPETGKPFPHDKVQWNNAVRAIQTSTSPDFIHWSPVRTLEYRDKGHDQHMYTNDVQPCPGAEHIYVGFPNRIVPTRNKFPGNRWPGVNDALFMASRDGFTWTRYSEAWVRPGRDQRNWTQRNNYPSWGIIETSAEEWSVLISEHYMQADGTPCQLRRLAVRPWGFVSVSAGHAGGEMLTHPLVFSGRELRVNYATAGAGSLQVEVCDVAGKALEGFALADMEPLFGDELDAVVTWKGGAALAAVTGHPVRLRVRLQDADLFALRTV
ncbi:MAG: hypothetical protein NTW19_18695 [Planctomycetota bacterium]|nr:hypothetical protein [Planctomycetota bacterium]